jgi:hypothetical protein
MENEAATFLPEDLEGTHPCGGPPTPAGGDESVSSELEIPTPEAYVRSGEHPSYTEMPEPPAQLPMDSPESPPGAPSPRESPSGVASAAFGLPPGDRPRRYNL